LPQIFNPGHRPSAPLYPDELVYCSVDDVANFLQLPLPDPILLADDSSIDGSDLKLPISGANYRRWKIEADTSITVYDNSDALGKTYTVSSVESAGSGNVNIVVPVIGAESFTTADSAQIQINSAFTNSKERGLTKSQVETLILEKQDYIDTVCRMAWRPYLVSEEYQNFTTFKPYRRRYYTDYVGAVYLRNRSVQRILRLSVWQGDKYRELGSSNVQMEIAKPHDLDSESIFICPGVAYQATLAQGTASNQWDGRFGAKTIAEQIANLINKDTATGKAAVSFGNLQENGKTLNVSDEILATSNSDEGDGIVFLSSMRSTEEGVDTTVAVTNPDAMVLSEGTLITGTIATVAGEVATLSITDGGTGYSDGSNINTTTTGEGTGLRVNISTTAGVITGLTIQHAGEDYHTGDTVTVTGGGGDATLTIETIGDATHFHTKTTDTGWSDAPALFYYTKGGTTYVARCSHAGSDYQFNIDEELVAGFASNLAVDDEIKQTRFKTDVIDEARQKDWWSMEDNGAIMFNNQYPFYENHSLKVSYIYGERYLDKVIKEACIKLVCMDIYLTDDYTVLFPEGTSNIDLNSKVQKLDEEVKRMLIPYQESIIVAGMGG